MTSDPPSLPGQLRAAIVLVGIEALGLAVLSVVLLIKTITGHPHSLAAALLGVALALFAAAMMALCAKGLADMSPVARSPLVVMELIALPVSYTLAFQAGLVAYGAPILIVALAVLYLVFTPPARRVLDREI